MMEIESSINKLMPQTQKTGKNVALGAAGVIFIALWLFMDFSDAEKQEIMQYKNRYEYLSRIYRSKGCD